MSEETSPVRFSKRARQFMEELAALRAERDSLKTAYDVVRADCVNLTEKVIPNLRARVAELEAALRATESAGAAPDV